MAKIPKPAAQPGKVKFRIIEFEMEGGDEALQDSLKNIAAVLMRGGSSPAAKPMRQETHRQLEATDLQAPVAEVEIVDLGEDEELGTIATPVVKRSSSTRKKIAPVKVLTEFRFDAISPTLKEFCLEKAPTTDLSKYLVIAHWYKNHLGIDDLTPDHFHTAYRFVGWSTPRDAAQPIRDLRHSRRGKFSGGKTSGTCTINHVGENTVNDMGAA